MSYADLDWRLEIQVARRAIHQIAVPSFEVRVDTSDGGNIAFSADSAKLTMMQESLEAAIKENAGTHSQRFQKYFN